MTTPNTHRPDRVKWETVNYLLKSDHGPREFFEWEYQLQLPDFLAAWDVWDYWERARIHSMRNHLKLGDVLFDVGAEVGWCSIVYATMVGPENMVLIEPTVEFWPNIKATWERNCGLPPRACFAGLIGDWNTGQATLTWPVFVYGPLIERKAYSYLHVNPELPQLTIDGLADQIGIPDALTIDVEGAELVVLRGAEETLNQHHPKIWVSVHPDLADRDYHTSTADLIRWMFNFDYQIEVLAVDHETHILFL